MLNRQYSSQRRNYTKKQLYKQNFYVHHPLLELIIQSKIQKCLKFGQSRDNQLSKINIIKNQNVHIIQAPFVMGNTKKLQIKMQRSRKLLSGFDSNSSRPRTTNTVIRSRTSEPRIRQKLQYLMREEEHFEETLKPTLSIKRFVQSRN